MTRAPSSSQRSRWFRPLTVACVPTGMKTGVGISPWAVCRIPARARVTGHSARSSKVIARGNAYCIAPGLSGKNYSGAMAAGTLSLEEYLSTVYEPDREYVDGELLERNRGESDHSGIQGIVLAILYAKRREYGIHV